MNPQDVIAQGREQIIVELGLGGLSVEEQDSVLDTLGDVLMRRIIIKILALLPEAERTTFEQLFTAEDSAGLEALIQKHIPNAQEVMVAEMRAGVEEYKTRVNGIIAERANSRASNPVPVM